jgi:hypothetical protein
MNTNELFKGLAEDYDRLEALRSYYDLQERLFKLGNSELNIELPTQQERFDEHNRLFIAIRKQARKVEELYINKSNYITAP